MYAYFDFKQAPIRAPGELYEFYDAIAYRKAAAVLNMLRAYIGDEVPLQL